MEFILGLGSSLFQKVSDGVITAPPQWSVAQRVVQQMRSRQWRLGDSLRGTPPEETVQAPREARGRRPEFSRVQGSRAGYRGASRCPTPSPDLEERQAALPAALP